MHAGFARNKTATSPFNLSSRNWPQFCQVAQQRTSALACIRRGASHSLALSLPAALAQGRGKRLDVEDQV